MTEDNQHTEAYLVLAKFLDEKQIQYRLEEFIHKNKSGYDAAQSEAIHKLYKKLMDSLKGKYSEDEYKAIYKSL